MIEMFKEGGFIMYPLLICSLAIWAVVFEKLWGLKKFKKENQALFDKAVELIKAGKLEEVKGLYQSAGTLISGPHLALLEHKDDDKTSLEERLQRRLTETQVGLKRYLWILGTIGSSAPFIGLFGTVWGIMNAFRGLSVTHSSSIQAVAPGIAEALIATAVGLAAAIPALMAYNHFVHQIKLLAVEMDNFSHEFLNIAERHFLK